ncbi:unnamed protein product [Victoria cruziana]
MARTWLIDSRGIARKVKNATQLSSCQITEWSTEAKRQCPNCNYEIDNTDVSTEWPGLPAGVKFDPTDVELLEHLAGKIGYGNAKPHLFIDEFIPTLDGKDGICFTHPENLPGIKKDGSSVHFFHRTTNAYNTGHRKRRRIHMGCDITQVRWHKTGKTKPVIENGVQKGCKKIMVLYSSSSKGNKADKANWVMHQYHLGTEDDEKDGEFVVSKIFYQHGEKKSNRSRSKNDAGKEATDQSREFMDDKTLEASPRTPKTSTPNPPRLGKLSSFEDGDERETHSCLLPVQGDVGPDAMWWLSESQAPSPIEPDDALLDRSLFCDEILEACPAIQELVLDQPLSLTEWNDVKADFGKDGAGSSIIDLDDIHLGALPDLADLQFGSQESIMSWLDRL